MDFVCPSPPPPNGPHVSWLGFTDLADYRCWQSSLAYRHHHIMRCPESLFKYFPCLSLSLFLFLQTILNTFVIRCKHLNTLLPIIKRDVKKYHYLRFRSCVIYRFSPFGCVEVGIALGGASVPACRHPHRSGASGSDQGRNPDYTKCHGFFVMFASPTGSRAVVEQCASCKTRIFLLLSDFFCLTVFFSCVATLA